MEFVKVKERWMERENGVEGELRRNGGSKGDEKLGTDKEIVGNEG